MGQVTHFSSLSLCGKANIHRHHSSSITNGLTVMLNPANLMLRKQAWGSGMIAFVLCCLLCSVELHVSGMAGSGPEKVSLCLSGKQSPLTGHMWCLAENIFPIVTLELRRQIYKVSLTLERQFFMTYALRPRGTNWTILLVKKKKSFIDYCHLFYRPLLYLSFREERNP